MDWWVPHIIRKLLELRCLKWAHITHLDTSNINYGQKKGRESNWQFHSWPLRVGNWPDFLACRWHATYHWKSLEKCYNFSLDLISIEGLHAKLWTPKVARVLTMGILGFSFGSPRTKWHLGAGPVARHIIYYKGEGRESCESELWWILWVRVCLWLVPALKMLELCINQLIV